MDPNILNIMIIIGLTSWMGVATVVEEKEGVGVVRGGERLADLDEAIGDLRGALAVARNNFV